MQQRPQPLAYALVAAEHDGQRAGGGPHRASRHGRCRGNKCCGKRQGCSCEQFWSSMRTVDVDDTVFLGLRVAIQHKRAAEGAVVDDDRGAGGDVPVVDNGRAGPGF